MTDPFVPQVLSIKADKIHRSTKKYFCIKREYDITFLDNFWVLIPNLAFIFLWHVNFWSYSERFFWVYKQLYANILAFVTK